MDESSPLKLSHKYEVLQAPPLFSVTSDKVPCRGSAVSSGVVGGRAATVPSLFTTLAVFPLKEAM